VRIHRIILLKNDILYYTIESGKKQWVCKKRVRIIFIGGQMQKNAAGVFPAAESCRYAITA
jgi:hypothetical protein